MKIVQVLTANRTLYMNVHLLWHYIGKQASECAKEDTVTSITDPAASIDSFGWGPVRPLAGGLLGPLACQSNHLFLKQRCKNPVFKTTHVHVDSGYVRAVKGPGSQPAHVTDTKSSSQYKPASLPSTATGYTE